MNGRSVQSNIRRSRSEPNDFKNPKKCCYVFISLIVCFYFVSIIYRKAQSSDPRMNVIDVHQSDQ